MIYLQQNNHPKKVRTRIIAGIFVFLVIIVVLIQILFSHFFPALVTSIVRPFWRIGFSIENGSLKSPRLLLIENESLKMKIEETNIRLRTIGAIESENAELKSFFGRNTSATSTEIGTSSVVSYFFRQDRLNSSIKNRRILVPVLMRPGIGIYDELIIDGGKDLGFNVGNKIYAPGDVLIGSISDTLSETSKISLFSSPENTLDVLIGPSNAPATAVGRGGGQYTAQLPRAVKISVGDFVIVPSIHDKPFGIVYSVESDPAQSFETILFAPPVNIYQLRWVLVELI